MMPTWVDKYSHQLLAKEKWIAIIGTIFAIIGGFFSVLLYKNLRTEIHELLPTDSRSVVDLNEVSSRLQSIDNLAVLIFSKDTQASKSFVNDLVKELQNVPKEIISSIDYQIKDELQFFQNRKALYVDLKDLIRIRDYVRQKIEFEKELYNPLNIFSGVEIAEPKLNLFALKQKYESRISDYQKFPDGYFATPDEKIRAVLVNLPGEASGIKGELQLKMKVETIIQNLNPRHYAPDIQIKYTGGVEEALEEHKALVSDLESSTIIVTALVAFAMLFYFKSLYATFALVISLLAGTAWTFGLSYFLVHYLNANSAFLGSIIIGNGINFGIIYLARYLEEIRKNRTHAEATKLAVTHTWSSTWTAALAAGFSYGSLALTSFRGFRQFGIIGLIGMILCWLSAFTLLPTYLGIFSKLNLPFKNRFFQTKQIKSSSLSFLSGKFSKYILVISLLITLLSLSTFRRISSNIIETNLTNLRNKESINHGAAYLSRYLDQIFQHYLSPLVILPHSRNSAIKIAHLLKSIQAQEKSSSLIASVQTIDDFIPKNQIEKIQILNEIRTLLPQSLLKKLSPQDRSLIQSFIAPSKLIPFTERDLPPLIKRKFTEKDGSIGKLVLVEPPLTHETWNKTRLINFIEEVRNAADQIEPKTAVAGVIAITSDMIRAISKDGPIATLFAFVFVVILVFLLFRKLSTALLVLFSLLLGAIWLIGIILGFDLKINFLNFIALPITFGIGVDYGVNIFQRFLESRTQNIIMAIRNTGSAVMLCSFTTSIGYASLIIASNQAFVSFGLLAVAGELTCVSAAVITLPAFLSYFYKFRTPQNHFKETFTSSKL